MENSIWAIIPSVFIIGCAILTRRIVFSLLAGLWLGSTILCSWNPFLGFLKMLQNYIIPALGSQDHATILLYGAAFGGFIAILQKTGGVFTIGEWFALKIKSARLGQWSAFILGIFIFVDDYFSCLTVGTVMRPIFDRLKICREKLAFLVDTTAGPVCLLVPLSTWVAYVVGLIGPELQKYEGLQHGNAFMVYLSTIPLNFYAIFAVLGTGIFLTANISFGAMYRAEERTRTTGDLYRPGAELPTAKEILETTPIQGIRPSLIHILLPLGVLFASLVFMFLYTGGFWAQDKPLLAVLREANFSLSILVAVLVAGGCGIVLGKIYGCFSLGQSVDHYTAGMKGMYMTFIILILAWSVSSMTKELKTAVYLKSLIQDNIATGLIPVLLFIFACGISFTTGTSYGTFAILTPIAVHLAVSMNLPIEYNIAAVLSGGVFGDHCSPVSDTTILSSVGSACNLMDHTITQLPYALLFAGSSALAFGLIAWIPYWIAALAGLTFFCIVAVCLNQKPKSQAL